MRPYSELISAPKIRMKAILGYPFPEYEYVGNQQKWDTFVKERSRGNGSALGLPQQAVVAFAAS